MNRGDVEASVAHLKSVNPQPWLVVPLRREFATRLAHLSRETWLADRKARFLGLVNPHERHRAARQRQILHEVDRVGLALARIRIAPKVRITGDTPARKPRMAIAPNFGFTPSRMLAPPARRGQQRGRPPTQAPVRPSPVRIQPAPCFFASG